MSNEALLNMKHDHTVVLHVLLKTVYLFQGVRKCCVTSSYFSLSSSGCCVFIISVQARHWNDSEEITCYNKLLAECCLNLVIFQWPK